LGIGSALLGSWVVINARSTCIHGLRQCAVLCCVLCRLLRLCSMPLQQQWLHTSSGGRSVRVVQCRGHWWSWRIVYMRAPLGVAAWFPATVTAVE
jgi:hypothetical protein